MTGLASLFGKYPQVIVFKVNVIPKHQIRKTPTGCRGFFIAYFW